MKKFTFLVFFISLTTATFCQTSDTTHKTIHIKKTAPKALDTTIHRGIAVTAIGKRPHKLMVTLMGKSDDNIPFAELQVASNIRVVDYDFSDTNNYVVVSFDLVFGHSGAFVTKHSTTGNFTNEMNTMINQVADGDIILVQNVKYKINGQGKELAVKGMTLKVIK